jgi:hypothetical protein
VKLRMDKTLRFWVDVAYENVKSDHPKLTKRRLIAQILHQYQDRGDAMRYLDVEGKIAWKASPRFLKMLADAERDAQDELEEFPCGSGDRDRKSPQLCLLVHLVSPATGEALGSGE